MHQFCAKKRDVGRAVKPTRRFGNLFNLGLSKTETQNQVPSPDVSMEIDEQDDPALQEFRKLMHDDVDPDAFEAGPMPTGWTDNCNSNERSLDEQIVPEGLPTQSPMPG